MGSKKKAPVAKVVKLHRRDRVCGVKGNLLFRLQAISPKEMRAIVSVEFVPLYKDGEPNYSLTPISVEVYSKKIKNNLIVAEETMKAMKAKYSNVVKTTAMITKLEKTIDQSKFVKRPKNSKLFMNPKKKVA